MATFGEVTLGDRVTGDHTHNHTVNPPACQDLGGFPSSDSIAKFCKGSNRSNPRDLTSCISSTAGAWTDEKLLADLGLDTHSSLTARTSDFAGLLNMGATCYANSFIQAMSLNKSFMQRVLAIDAPSDSALEALQILLARLKLSCLSKVSPLEFLEKFAIRLNMQEDASEFGTLFLTWLGAQPGGAAAKQLFAGEMEHVTTCSQCGHSRVTSEPFLELRINLPEDKKVALDFQSLLAGVTQEENVIDGFACVDGKCEFGQRGMAARKSRIRKFPPHLRVILNRYTFSLTTGREKITTPVRITLGALNIDCAETESHVQYECEGILEHHSERVSSGHYTAALKNSSRWYSFDDSLVRPIEVEEAEVDGVGKGKRKSSVKRLLNSQWTRESCQSSSAYIVLLRVTSLGADEGAEIEIAEKFKKIVENENFSLQLEVDQRKSAQARVQAILDKRRSVREELLEGSGGHAGEVVGIRSKFLTSWLKGDDSLIYPRTGMELIEPCPKLCRHGGIEYLSILRGEVKFVPKSVQERIEAEMGSVVLPNAVECVECIRELAEQLELGRKWYSLVRDVGAVKFDSVWGRSDMDEYSGQGGVWICKPNVPKISRIKWFTSATSLLERIVSDKAAEGEVGEDALSDLGYGLMCSHGVFESERVRNDSDYVIKPHRLVDELVRISDQIDPALMPFVKRVTLRTKVDVGDPMERAGRCEECQSDVIGKSSEESGLKRELLDFFKKLDETQISTQKQIPVDSTFSVLPTAFLDRLRVWSKGGKAALPKQLHMDSLLCPHGDLKFDLLDQLETPTTPTEKTGKRKALFTLVPSEGMRFLFDGRLGIGGEPPVCPVVERDRTGVVHVCPLVCTLCQSDTGAGGFSGVNVRVFHETAELLDGPTKSVRVEFNNTLIMYKPGRSRLVGRIGAVGPTSTGIDIKLELVDVGVLEQAPLPISPDDAIDRLRIFVAHPTMRGSLVLIPDELSILDTMAKFPGESRSQRTEEVFVEFVNDSAQAEANPKRMKRAPAASDKDAGLQGSILRGL